MPGPRRSIDEYLADRIQQFGALGARVDDIQVLKLPDGDATLTARVDFDARARLMAFEHVRIEDDRPHRVKYSYNVFLDGEFLFRYDRDPNHPDMVEHKHIGDGDRRIPTDRRTLHDVAEEIWDNVRARPVQTPVQPLESESSD